MSDEEDDVTEYENAYRDGYNSATDNAIEEINEALGNLKSKLEAMKKE